MNEDHNNAVAVWARQNIPGRVEIKLLFGSRMGKILVYMLLFSVPAAFFALGFLFLILGSRDRSITFGPIVFGVLTTIPAGVIAVLGAYTRRGLARSLDVEGINVRTGQKFRWAKLQYVDHVTKHIRAGGVTRRIKDNQLELVFDTGKVIILPIIHDRQAIWNLINSMPVEVRDDGTPRPTQGEHIATATP
ncbi:MAG: hypothetical protein QM785_15290 [Pyrinomonadaceae bacterium]